MRRHKIHHHFHKTFFQMKSNVAKVRKKSSHRSRQWFGCLRNVLVPSPSPIPHLLLQQTTESLSQIRWQVVDLYRGQDSVHNAVQGLRLLASFRPHHNTYSPYLVSLSYHWPNVYVHLFSFVHTIPVSL